eukprot:6190127-Pleurochrysis_carterae.AAC.1
MFALRVLASVSVVRGRVRMHACVPACACVSVRTRVRVRARAQLRALVRGRAYLERLIFLELALNHQRLDVVHGVVVAEAVFHQLADLTDARARAATRPLLHVFRPRKWRKRRPAA